MVRADRCHQRQGIGKYVLAFLSWKCFGESQDFHIEMQQPMHSNIRIPKNFSRQKSNNIFFLFGVLYKVGIFFEVTEIFGYERSIEDSCVIYENYVKSSKVYYCFNSV